MNVKTELLDFISINENNGALLLTGKWGCGKSFLLKKMQEELNQGEEYAVAIVSLFGVDTVPELNRRVKEKYLELSAGLLGKVAQKTVKTVGNIAKESATIASVAMPESLAAATISQGMSSVLSFDALSFVKVKNKIGIKGNKSFVLVFDDFERSDIPVKQLLGAINEFSENNAIKTIIIADEDKIQSKEYSEFKEKLIYRTIKFTSDYPSILQSIIENYNESCDGYRSFLIANQKRIIEAFVDSTDENIRTAKAFIMNFERAYDAWKRSGISLEKAGEVIYIFGAVTFEYKANNFKKSTKYGDVLATSEIKNKYTSYNDWYYLYSLQKWITEGIWDENYFISELQRKLDVKELSNDEKFLMYRFWDLDKEIIDSGVPKALERAYRGDLGCDELIRLLENLYLLKNYNINLACDVNYPKILSGLEDREERIKNGEVTEPDRHTFIVDEAVAKMDGIAQSIYKKIERMRDRINAWETRRQIISYLKGEKSSSRYELKHRPIVSFDDELLYLFLEQYKVRENSVKQDMFFLLKDLCYNDKHVSAKEDIMMTASNLKILTEELEKFKESCNDPITKIIKEEVVKIIQEMQENLKV